jgi:hypothetical protein
MGLLIKSFVVSVVVVELEVEVELEITSPEESVG